MLERRITYRRNSAYRTRSNNFKPVKTPGGRLVLQLIKKHTKGTGMQGVKVARPHDFKRMTSSKRTDSRASKTSTPANLPMMPKRRRRRPRKTPRNEQFG